MDAARMLLFGTTDQPWEIWIDSPIGRKRSILVFHLADGVLSGDMTDLFGTPLAMFDIELSDSQLRWRLEVTRPIKVSLLFEAQLAGRTLTGVIRSKYPDIGFSGLTMGL